LEILNSNSKTSPIKEAERRRMEEDKKKHGKGKKVRAQCHNAFAPSLP